MTRWWWAGILLQVGIAPASLAAEPAAAPPLVITAVGDVNLGTAFPSDEYLPPGDGSALLAPVREWLSGDVVFGNLEGPLADSGETRKCARPEGCYAFRTPTRFAAALKEAGFTVLSLANNHANDFGEEGRQSTLKALDQAGIAHSGPVGDVALLPVRGQTVALIAYAPYDHSHNLLDLEEARKTVSALSERYPIVIVSMHAGTEGINATRVSDAPEFLGKEPRGHLIAFAHAVIDAGADLVIGHGPHVVRGLEVYRRRLIAYSLGNFCTYARFSLDGALGQAVILRVELDPASGELLGGQLHSTFQVKPGGAKPDPEARGAKLLRALSWQDFRFSAPPIDEAFRIGPPAGDAAGLFTLPEAADRLKLKALLLELAKAGFADQDLTRWFGDRRAELLPQVLESFARPAEKLPYQKYRKFFIQPKVLEAGAAFLVEQAELLTKVEEAFGVERELLCGLIATETRFGTHRGEHVVLNALSTLALKDERRAAWATRQLAALLRTFRADPLAVLGSYAGAVGLVQFIPSSIGQFGQDFDRDGKIDLDGWADALASAAHYLKESGWKFGKPVDPKSQNFRAILKYNPSSNYAKVVLELAQEFGFRKN